MMFFLKLRFAPFRSAITIGLFSVTILTAIPGWPQGNDLKQELRADIERLESALREPLPPNEEVEVLWKLAERSQPAW